MRVKKNSVKVAIAAAGIVAATTFGAGVSSAAPAIQGFGASQQLISGPLITSYTVSNLQQSTIAIPGFTPKGTIYEATISAKSDAGTVTPLVRNFSARGPNGQTYKLIDKASAPNGLNPAPIPQGNESTGSLYFDVTGAPPNGVVYNDGFQDVLIWTSNMTGEPAPGAPPNSGPVPGGLPAPTTSS